MDSAQLKRMILEGSEKSGIRRKMVSREAGITEDDIIEMGQALEQTVNTKGWNFVEAYLIRKCDPTTFLFGNEDDSSRGEARGAINLMQYVDQAIKAKNEILQRINDERTAAKAANGHAG